MTDLVSHFSQAWSPGALRARVLHRDSNLIVLDKPAGLAVHGGPKTSVHLEGMLEALRFGLGQAPRPAHRLDRDTSGCLVLARHDKALSRMGRLFGAGKVRKIYWAVLSGRVGGDEGRIDLPLRKITDRTGWRMVVDPAGAAAATEWRVLGRTDAMTWLELHPLSGRTHQIRVHCASGLGCPLVGEAVYGHDGGRPLHLHSRRIAIPYWLERPAIEVTAPPPLHMRGALTLLGFPNQG